MVGRGAYLVVAVYRLIGGVPELEGMLCCGIREEFFLNILLFVEL